ncbi:MAG: nucleotidyltransferase [Isosphaeraceae bacterium]
MVEAKARIALPKLEIAELCRRSRIRRLSIFGSALRDDFCEDSDVDLLIEYEDGYSPGWEIVDLAEEFSSLFGGREVDLVNRKYLNDRLKDRVFKSAVLLYEQV